MLKIHLFLNMFVRRMGSSRLPLQKKDAASRWFASDQKCMRLTSTFELSLGSI